MFRHHFRTYPVETWVHTRHGIWPTAIHMVPAPPAQYMWRLFCDHEDFRFLFVIPLELFLNICHRVRFVRVTRPVAMWQWVVKFHKHLYRMMTMVIVILELLGEELPRECLSFNKYTRNSKQQTAWSTSLKLLQCLLWFLICVKLRVRLKGLVVPQNLCSRCCGHGCLQAQIKACRRCGWFLNHETVKAAKVCWKKSMLWGSKYWRSSTKVT